MVLALVVLIAVLVFPMRGGGAQEAVSPGNLEVTVAPAQLTATGVTATARIANTGGAPVTELVLEACGPAGVDASVDPTQLGSLAGGASVLVAVTVRGMTQMQPAILVVHAEGRSAGGPVAGVGSVELPVATPPVTLELVGQSRLAQRSPAELVTVVTNVSNSGVTAQLRAEAGQHDVRIATTKEGLEEPVDKPLPLDINPGATEVVRVRVNPVDPLRRGSALVVVIADVTPKDGALTQAAADPPMKIVATSELNVAPPLSDVIPEPYGAGSALILPGLVGVGAGLFVWYRDRRRMGVHPRSVDEQIWENKVWLVAAIGISFIAASIYQAFGVDLLGATDLTDLMGATVLTGVVCALLSWAYVCYHRRKTPLITRSSTPLVVMEAAGRADASVRREVYRAPGEKFGLLVHRDGQVIVLSPPIGYSRPDAVGKVLEEVNKVRKNQKDGQLKALLEKARSADPGFDGAFVADDHYVPGPGAVEDAVLVPGRLERLVKYEQ